MYLSKIVLRWPACRDPYQWHRIIWRLFPGEPDAKREFLFACLDKRPGQDITTLLLSMDKPKEIQVAEISIVGQPKALDALSFKAGQNLRFRLTANPTKVFTEQTEQKRKIRIPLVKSDQQEAWLKRKLDGIALIDCVLPKNEPPIYFSRRGKAGKIVPVTFEGRLKVIDPQKFKTAYMTGIGPAKAFGCGLMLVKT